MKTTSLSRGVSLDDVPGNFPGNDVPDQVDLENVAEQAVHALREASPPMFHPEVLWKDWLCLTGRVVTTHSPLQVSLRWKNAATAKQPTNFRAERAFLIRPVPDSSWVNVVITFDATHDSLSTKCGGCVSVVPNKASPRGWHIWMITTWLENFPGYGHPDLHLPPKPVRLVPDHQLDGSAENSLSVIIIGSGQQGLTLAARLQALGIDYLVVEKGSNVANSWLSRYDSVKLHTIREMNHLPFGRTWPSDAPQWLPARMVAEGFQQFVEKFGIAVWTKSYPISCAQTENGWLVKVQTSAEIYTIRVKHVALGMGVGIGGAKAPEVNKQDRFIGDVLHSTDYRNSNRWRGRRAIIVGSGTSAFDIAQDMADSGLAAITMIQRGATAIFPIRAAETGQSALYNAQIPTAVAERMVWSVPEKIAMKIVDSRQRLPDEAHANVLDGLERVGFQVDRESKLNDLALNRYGGYYPDVGATSLLINGAVKVKSGIAIEEFTSNGLRFKDGEHIEADIVLFATGFEHNMAALASLFVEQHVAEHLEDIWGIDNNGDLKGLMKPALPGLWPMSGGIPQARWFSQFIALQIQADLLEKPIIPDAV